MNDKITGMGMLNELSELITIRMSSFWESEHGESWIEHKMHHDYDLWFLQEGKAKITVHGKEHTVMPGDVVFFYPGVPYTAAACEGACRFMYVHFDFRIGHNERILSELQLPGIISASLIHDETFLLVQAYQRLKQQGSKSGNRLYVKACLTAVIAKIIELHALGQYHGNFLDSDTKIRTSERSLDVLQPVLAFIDENLHQSFKMSELAALVGISEKYFISYFKKALGITPGQYIYQIKMNRARDYLYEKKYSIQEIAAFLGYPDPFTFSKAFKKYYNVPPSRFD
ncbi:AraC family transcriptional regulator [Paenibacillus massiliensis]|uniref:AraC family transcriptional regulator n=1 Tax=Paenibacillus massiliensis TaxID=225917 RepID=UPI00037E5681|nr:AraC family transcriptional regulator [Paenibacillus massiliensis]